MLAFGRDVQVGATCSSERTGNAVDGNSKIGTSAARVKDDVFASGLELIAIPTRRTEVSDNTIIVRYAADGLF